MMEPGVARLVRVVWTLTLIYLVVRGLIDLGENAPSVFYAAAFVIVVLGGPLVYIDRDQRREREKRRSEGRF